MFTLYDGISVPWIHCCSSCITALAFEVEQERFWSSAVHLLSSICKAKMMLVAGYNPSHELLRVVASQLWRGRQSQALFLSYFLLRIPRCLLWPEMPLFQVGCKLFLPDSHGFDLSY